MFIDATMGRHGHSTHALIETIHTAQEAFGYLNLRPPGENTNVVCTGTACYIKGAGQLLDVVTRRHGVEGVETTADGKLSMLEARCIGSRGLAPAVVFDNDVAAQVTP